MLEYRQTYTAHAAYQTNVPPSPRTAASYMQTVTSVTGELIILGIRTSRQPYWVLCVVTECTGPYFTSKYISFQNNNSDSKWSVWHDLNKHAVHAERNVGLAKENIAINYIGYSVTTQQNH